ncbi:helix-turn-helix domain-containing protein [Nocardiopsis deserti]|uniref:helix-turn-helix domain-containing protein n=1 Tax=Nocardiopsis deserti TaxID=2605988 RepID=UPI00123A1761|nr:helix-turn-helix transcriptional regulator [Nocardiopsis deserti]
MPPKVQQQWVPFGNEVRRLRNEAGFSQAALGVKLQISAGMVGHIERAVRSATRAQVDKMEVAFATDGELLRLWSEITRNRTVPHWFQDVLLMERKSRRIEEYHPILVPGLLQTAEYAEVLVRSWQPQASDDEVREIVDSRVQRLTVIKERRPALWFIVDEVVVTRAVGSVKIMADQLHQIIGLAQDGTIRVQVLPTRLRHPGICPPFRVMALDTQSVVYAEHALGGQTESNPEEVAKMMVRFGAMQADAMSPDDTVAYLEELQKGLG